MKIAIWPVAAILFTFGAAAQTGPNTAVPDVPTSSLRLTVNYPPASVISSMFGVLPKDVALVEVTACNDTPATLLVSNGRVVQALRKNGVEALSRDAAISTIQNSEGRAWKNILLRNATHGLNIVNFLVISKSVTLGPVLSKTLPSIQALMEAIVPEFGKDVPMNQYLNFDRDALPAKTQLTPLDCVAGLMFTMKSTGAVPTELVVDVPSVNITPTAVGATVRSTSPSN